MRVRPTIPGNRVIVRRDHAHELRMRAIDAGIDHGHEHAAAIGEPVGFGKPQLGDCILRRVAFGRRLAILLLQGEGEIRLRRRNPLLAGKRADHVRNRPPVVDAPAVEGAPGQRQGPRPRQRQMLTCGDRIERLRRNVRNIEHHFIGHEAALAGGRQHKTSPDRSP